MNKEARAYEDYLAVVLDEPVPVDNSGEEMKVFSSGARRSGQVTRYDLIPMEGMTRLAQRYELGSKKYDDNNWKKGLGDTEFVQQMKNHLIQHMLLYLEEGCLKDDNLAAIAWNAFALMEAERYQRERVIQ